MTFLADLEEFVADHRPHGILGSGVGDPTTHGYRLQMACHCGCGVVFERWITLEEANRDLIVLARAN